MLKIDRINELAYGLNFSNQNVYDFVPASKDMKNTILIIGKTGAGKSTIMNVLANRKLFGRKEKGNLIIDAVDSVSKIVHGGNSGTDKPKCYID
jgi:type IV secretory pathway VirB4 component